MKFRFNSNTHKKCIFIFQNSGFIVENGQTEDPDMEADDLAWDDDLPAVRYLPYKFIFLATVVLQRIARIRSFDFVK